MTQNAGTQHTDTDLGAATATDPSAPAVSPVVDPATGPERPRSTHFELRRSRTDRMLGGVCGGLAAGLGADPALLRVLLVALTLVTGGAAAIVYAAAWALAPLDPPSA